MIYADTAFVLMSLRPLKKFYKEVHVQIMDF